MFIHNSSPGPWRKFPRFRDGVTSRGVAISPLALCDLSRVYCLLLGARWEGKVVSVCSGLGSVRPIVGEANCRRGCDYFLLLHQPVDEEFNYG